MPFQISLIPNRCLWKGTVEEVKSEFQSPLCAPGLKPPFLYDNVTVTQTEVHVLEA